MDFSSILSFFLKFIVLNVMIKNLFKVSKFCLKFCYNVGQFNFFFCIYYYIYKVQYMIFQFLNICIVFYNFFWFYIYILLVFGKFLMFQVRWIIKVVIYLIQILFIFIYQERVILEYKLNIVFNNVQFGRLFFLYVVIMYWQQGECF